MSKAKAAKVEESEIDRALAQVSQQKWDRYKQLHRPTEQAHLARIGQDTSAVLRGRAGADVAQASEGAMGQAIQLGRGSIGGLGASARTLGNARTMAMTGANAAAEGERTKQQIGALQIGNDMSADAQSGLSTLARQANQEALAKARAQTQVNLAKSAAINDTIGGAMSGYSQGKASQQQADQYMGLLSKMKGEEALNKIPTSLDPLRYG